MPTPRFVCFFWRSKKACAREHTHACRRCTTFAAPFYTMIKIRQHSQRSVYERIAASASAPVPAPRHVANSASSRAFRSLLFCSLRSYAAARCAFSLYLMFWFGPSGNVGNGNRRVNTEILVQKLKRLVYFQQAETNRWRVRFPWGPDTPSVPLFGKPRRLLLCLNPKPSMPTEKKSNACFFIRARVSATGENRKSVRGVREFHHHPQVSSAHTCSVVLIVYW